jgi:hypothetical protein
MAEKVTKKLGEILVEDGLIRSPQLTEALAHQREHGSLLGQILVEKGFIDEDSLVSTLGKQFRIPYIPLARYALNPDMASLLEADFCGKHHVVAFDGDARSVFLAIANPLADEAVSKVRELTGREPKVFISRISEILNAIFYLYHEKK